MLSCICKANLASTNREKQRVAARCVGDLVSKLGARTEGVTHVDLFGSATHAFCDQTGETQWMPL